MNTLTDVLPKPLHPCVEKTLLDQLMQTLSDSGVSSFTVGVGWHGDKIDMHIHSGEFRHRTRIVHVRGYEVGPLQTLTTALQSVDNNNEDVLVVPADAFIPVSMFRDVMQAHQRENLLTLAVDPYKERGTPVYVDTDHRLIHVGNKTASQYRIGVAAMFFVAQHDLLTRCAAGLSRGMTRVVDVLNWLLSAREKIGYVLTTGTWFDIDTIEQLLVLNHHILSSGHIATNASITLREGDTLYFDRTVRYGQDTVVEQDVEIEGPCIVTEGCHIGQGSHLGPYVVIRDRSCLMESCVISESVIFGHSVVPAQSRVESALVYDSIVYM